MTLVTGASSGIGAAVSRKILERGGRLVAVALDLAELQETFGTDDERVHLLPIDLAKTEDISAALQALPADFRTIECVVNCAGHDVGGRVRFDAAKEANFVSVIGVNLVAMMVVTHAVLPGMIARGRGDILNIGSISSREPGTTITAYTTSKFGVHGFSLALRNDLADTDIRVMEILPGPVRTNFATRRWHGDRDKGKAYYDNRPACLTPEQVADSAAWALDQPPEVTIAEIIVLPTRLR